MNITIKSLITLTLIIEPYKVNSNWALKHEERLCIVSRDIWEKLCHNSEETGRRGKGKSARNKCSKMSLLPYVQLEEA